MNKHVFGRKLSRSRPAREALFAGLTRALILHGKIETTFAKAKAVQGEIERFVTLAKKGDLASERRALSGLDNDREIVKDLFHKVAPVFTARTSGYTRITLLPVRKGDNAKMAKVEWTEAVDYQPKSKKENKAKAAEPKKVAKNENVSTKRKRN